MNVNEILDEVKDILIELEDSNFKVSYNKNDKESSVFIYHHFYISYEKLFTIDNLDKYLFRINNFIKETEIPFAIFTYIPSEGKKKLHFYNDNRYIRYEGIKLRDWILLNWIEITILEKR